MRAYPLPPWLPLAPDPPGRTAVVEHACALLSRSQAMVSLVAAPGTGATTVAGAVAARMARKLPVCCLRLAGYGELPQLFHAIGDALGASFPRDQAAVCEALREAGPVLLILDDADQPGTETAIERLAAVAVEARFLTVGRSPVLEQQVIHLSPLLGTEDSQLDPALGASPTLVPGAGNLVLRHLVELGGADDPWAFLDELPEGADLLAAFPAGIPAGRPRGVPATLLLPSAPGRTVMRRCVAESMQARRRRSDRDLALALLPRCGQILRLAEEPSLIAPPHPADLVLLEHIAGHHPDPSEAARAWAAWSRFVVAAGQASAARVWHNAAADTPRGGRSEALLAWAEGDALLAEGDQDNAQVAFELAATQLRRSGDLRLQANLHLRSADQLQARGATAAAEEHAHAAHELFERLGDPLGRAMSHRSLACGHLASGDRALADAALCQAEALLQGRDDEPLPCSLHLTRLALLIAQGALEEAEERATLVRATLGTQPLQRGTFERLLAELAIRRDQIDEAETHLERALDWLGEAGDRAALGIALRLYGDVAALRGQAMIADQRYQRASREQVRAGAIEDLARTLEHRACLEREHGNAEVAERLTELGDELLSLSGPG